MAYSVSVPSQSTLSPPSYKLPKGWAWSFFHPVLFLWCQGSGMQCHGATIPSFHTHPDLTPASPLDTGVKRAIFVFLQCNKLFLFLFLSPVSSQVISSANIANIMYQ